MKYSPKLPETNVNISNTSPLKELFTLVAGLIACVVGIYLALGLVVDFLAPRISPEFEKRMGSILFHQVDSEHKLHPPAAAKQLQYLVDRMLNRKCAEVNLSIEVHIYQNPMVNAVALPGGKILVFSGLLDNIKTENELAFVLAHEIGHAAHKDHLRSLGRMLVFMTIATALGGDNTVGQFMAQFINFAEMGFSRNRETLADEYALDVLDCMYGHVSGSIHFFQTLQTHQRGQMGGHYFSTHPETQRRIQHLKAYAQQRGYVQGTTIPFDNTAR